MTKPARPHLIPLEDLTDAIVDTLRSAPRTIGQLVNLTGWSDSAVYVRLLELESDSQVHRKTARRHHLWHYGRPDGSPPPPRPAAGLRRDPLVSALFGPAKEAA